MGWLSSLGALATAAAEALGWANKRQDQLDRQEAKQDGARQQQNEDLAAENEELRKDAKIYARPSEVGDDLDWLRARARQLRRPSGDGENDD